MSDRITGTVKFFNGDKGFGFIAPANGDKDVFVHYSALPDNGGYRNLNEGDQVEFSIESSSKGPRAADVVKL